MGLSLIFLILSIISGQLYINDTTTYTYFVLQLATLNVSIVLLVGEMRERRRRN